MSTAGAVGATFAVALLCFAFGCSKPTTVVSPQPPKTPTTSASPNRALFEQVRAGRYQFSLSADELANAYTTVRTLEKLFKGDDLTSVRDAAELIDGAGHRVVDLAEDPPTLQDVDKNPKAFKEWRERAINDANDSIFEIRQAESVLLGMADFAKGENRSALIRVHQVVDEARDGLEVAIDAMDGTVEPYDPGGDQ